MKIPEALDRAADIVLKYKPKPKSEKAVNREKKRRRVRRKKARE